MGMLLEANILSVHCIRQAGNAIFLSSLLKSGMSLILMLSLLPGAIARASAGAARAIFCLKDLQKQNLLPNGTRSNTRINGLIETRK